MGEEQDAHAAIDLVCSDWRLAWDNVRRQRRMYEEAISTPGLNVTHILNTVIAPLVARYISGERSPDLHREMMAVGANDPF